MKIVFNLSTPKTVRFFLPFAEQLRARGVDVGFVGREYTELSILGEALGVETEMLGRHGGPTLLGKLLASAERIGLLAHYFDRVKPDALIALGNHESVRAAFGLGIPVVSFSDIPEYEAVARLTLPLATRVCAPWIIPEAVYRNCGVAPERLHIYHALDPLAWLPFTPIDTSYVEKLGFDSEQPLIVCRETEWQSGYVSEDIVRRARDELARRHPSWQFVDIPRYETHRYYDAPSLLAGASLLIGGGGTMCIEAAYYGTPVIATRPLRCHYMEWLFAHDLARNATTVEDTVRLVEDIVETRVRWSAAAGAAFGRMRFPLEELTELIVDTAKP